MPRRNRTVTANSFLTASVFLVAAAVAGCGHSGSFDVQDSGPTQMNELMARVQFKEPPKKPRPADLIQCPEIVVLEGTSADRVYTAGSQANDALRYQFSVLDVARDCRIDGSQISMKVGVDGKILLGPAGSPGSFAAPIRVVIVREVDQAPVFSKLYHIPTAVPAGETQGIFTLVTEPLNVPYTSEYAVHGYTIKVGFDSALDKKDKDKAQPQQANAAAVPPTASGRQHRHHRHDQTQ
jgi:hypothetical protein